MKRGVGGLWIKDMRAQTLFSTVHWYHLMSFDITQCHFRSVPNCPSTRGRCREGVGRAGAGASQERVEAALGKRGDGDMARLGGDPKRRWTVLAWIVNWSGPIYERCKEPGARGRQAFDGPLRLRPASISKYQPSRVMPGRATAIEFLLCMIIIRGWNRMW